MAEGGRLPVQIGAQGAHQPRPEGKRSSLRIGARCEIRWNRKRVSNTEPLGDRVNDRSERGIGREAFLVGDDRVNGAVDTAMHIGVIVTPPGQEPG
jgi:hypothetical protein